MNKRMFIRSLFSFMLVTVLTVTSLLSIDNVSAAVRSWYRVGNKITHAAGGLNGVPYTNSVEALDNSLKHKKKLIEMDFIFTSDNVLVGRHGWESNNNIPQTYDQYINTPTPGGNTGISAVDVINKLAEQKNTYLIVDTREEDVVKTYKEIYDICIKYNHKDFLKRIVPQFYSQSEFKQIKSVYKWKDYIFTLYKLKPKKDSEFKSIATFCKRNKVKVVTMPKAKVTKKRVKILKSKGLYVFTHTVNSEKEFRNYKKAGVKGIYTDFL